MDVDDYYGRSRKDVDLLPESSVTAEEILPISAEGKFPSPCWAWQHRYRAEASMTDAT